jgi:hypothetical protein
MKIRVQTPFRMTLSTSQENALDKLWSQAVKTRAGKQCEMCLTTSSLQSHHVIGRRNKTLRHIVSNGCCLCAKHHFFAEQNGVKFAQWIIRERGQKWWDDLESYGREVKVWKEYTTIKSYLESFIKD